MGRFQNQILGLIRFSFPSTDGFALSSGTVDGAADRLFEPERMRRRMDLFKNLCLPSIRAQTDQDFKVILMVGWSMPEIYLEELADLLIDDPLIRVMSQKPGPHYKSIKLVYDRVNTFKATHRTTFRLDDDDMIDADYISRLRRVSRHMAQLTPHRPVAVAFQKGYYLSVGDNPGIKEVAEPTPLGLGLSLTAPVAYKHNIYAWNHRLVPQKVSTFAEQHTPSWIRTLHQDNDGDRSDQLSGTASTDALDEQLKSAFGMDFKELSKRANGQGAT